LAFNGLVSPDSPTTPTPSSTGGTVSLQDTIAQVAVLERAIQDQSRLITEFLRSNKDTSQLVQTELKGSTKGYDQRMTDALSQAESSLNLSLSSLQQAATALSRVRAI
jgi:hypothetical protein